jgi:hypothetical protein
MNEHGTTTHNGTEYNLTEEADMTNRCLPVHDYNDAAEGDTYSFEMSARAVDPAGNDVRCYWVFEAVKGDEQELEAYDYSECDRVEVY